MNALNGVTSPYSRTVAFKNWFMLSARISSYGCTREVWRAREKRKSCSRRQPRATLVSWVFSKLPKCIHNSIYAQLKTWTNSFITWRKQLGRWNMFLFFVVFCFFVFFFYDWLQSSHKARWRKIKGIRILTRHNQLSNG